jgi:hypothetical protein
LQPGAADVQPSGACCRHAVDLQVSGPHSAVLLQLTSHAHDAPHATLRHEPAPLQSTLQGPVPQVRLRQLCEPLHVILHALLPTQLTPLRHELPVEHEMLQLQPAGQVTAALHAPPFSMQSIVQLLSPGLHDVHCDGQVPASPTTAPSRTLASSWVATHRPSLQIRPELQSAWVSHAKSPLRWLTEQPAATTHTTIPSQRATSFTVSLRS